MLRTRFYVIRSQLNLGLDDFQLSMTFRILPGLPGEGAAPKQFTYGHKRTHSEGLVVEFSPPAAPSWVGNFQPAIGSHFGTATHPNAHDVIVVAGGECYVVDPVTSELKATFGGAIQGLWTDSSGRFQLSLPRGVYTVRVRAFGYEEVRDSIAVPGLDGYTVVAVLAHPTPGLIGCSP